MVISGGSLNPFLFPANSPIAQNQGQTSAYAFDYENEAGIISSAKIRNAAITNAQIGTAAIGTANIGTLSFNEIHGGTATFGGSSNGNGVVLVKGTSGTTHVQLDNTGITVNNGSITINNSGGTVSYDSSGVVSESNFANSLAVAAGGLNQPIAGTTPTVFTGGTLQFSNARQRVAILTGNLTWFHASTTVAYCIAELKLDGTVKMDYWLGNKYTDIITIGQSMPVVIPAGTHTLTMDAYGGTAGTTTIFSYNFSYSFLGT